MALTQVQFERAELIIRRKFDRCEFPILARRVLSVMLDESLGWLRRTAYIPTHDYLVDVIKTKGTTRNHVGVGIKWLKSHRIIRELAPCYYAINPSLLDWRVRERRHQGIEQLTLLELPADLNDLLLEGFIEAPPGAEIQEPIESRGSSAVSVREHSEAVTPAAQSFSERTVSAGSGRTPGSPSQAFCLPSHNTPRPGDVSGSEGGPSAGVGTKNVTLPGGSSTAQGTKNVTSGAPVLEKPNADAGLAKVTKNVPNPAQTAPSARPLPQSPSPERPLGSTVSVPLVPFVSVPLQRGTRGDARQGTKNVTSAAFRQVPVTEHDAAYLFDRIEKFVGAEDMVKSENNWKKIVSAVTTGALESALSAAEGDVRGGFPVGNHPAWLMNKIRIVTGLKSLAELRPGPNPLR